MYMVLQLNKEIEINVMGEEVKLPLSYAKGMIGALPVFELKADAEAFAGDKYAIAKIAAKE